MMPTAAFEQIVELIDAGLYTDALEHFDRLPSAIQNQYQPAVVRGELCERGGRLRDARAILQPLNRTKTASASDLSSIELTLARIDWEEGSTTSAISRIQ